MDAQSYCSAIVFELPNERAVYNKIEFELILCLKYNSIFRNFIRICDDLLNIFVCVDPVLVLVNIFTVFILTRKELRTSYNVVFVCMALEQGFAIFCRYLLFSTDSPDAYACSFIHKLPWQLIEIGIENSFSILTAHVAWLAVIIAYVRLRQLNSSKLKEPSIRYMITLCCCSFALIIIASVPFFLTYDIILFEKACDSEKLKPETFAFVMASGRLHEHNCLLLRIAFFSSGVLFNVLPCSLLVFLSSALVIRIRKIQKNRSALLDCRSSATSAESVRSSLMIAMIVCTTLLTNILQATLSIMVGFMSDRFQSAVSTSHSFIIILVTIASTSNLAIHLSMSRQFREVTKNYLCCVCRKTKHYTTTLLARPSILPTYVLT